MQCGNRRGIDRSVPQLQAEMMAKAMAWWEWTGRLTTEYVQETASSSARTHAWTGAASPAAGGARQRLGWAWPIGGEPAGRPCMGRATEPALLVLAPLVAAPVSPRPAFPLRASMCMYDTWLGARATQSKPTDACSLLLLGIVLAQAHAVH
jgi:hypothetical protein